MQEHCVMLADYVCHMHLERNLQVIEDDCTNGENETDYAKLTRKLSKNPVSAGSGRIAGAKAPNSPLP